MSPSITISFTEKLRAYLVLSGFTHIKIIGLQDNTENYIVSLLIENDPLLNFEEVDSLMRLDGMDVLEMTVVGADPIQFFITMPENIYYNSLTS